MRIKAERGTPMFVLLTDRGHEVERALTRAELMKTMRAYQRREDAIKECKRILKRAGFGEWLITCAFKVMGY